MQIYKVGGAVRDRLLRRPVTEVDWLVVGTPENAASSFRQSVRTSRFCRRPARIRLARTEPGGRGYGGFTFHASVPSKDLQRDRINAIAEDDQGS